MVVFSITHSSSFKVGIVHSSGGRNEPFTKHGSRPGPAVLTVASKGREAQPNTGSGIFFDRETPEEMMGCLSIVPLK